MRFSLLFATAMLIACSSHRTAAQALCPDGGTKTDPGNPATPPVSTNGGPVNTFNWYYGDFMPGSYSGTLYKLKSTADATPYLELPWQQANNINVERFQGKNDIPANG